jgi:arginine repressor|tara:strand:+ start:78 stop:509 length:432 start_codon:yes stop_codon:yes gene_type:complete
MKTKLKFKKLTLNTLIALFVLTASSELVAQEKKSDNLKNFKVVVEKTDNGIKMQSVKGSAWIDLSFSINNDKPQAIDEYGMTVLNKISSEKDSNLADFLFTITKTENGIVLKGIEGTAWTDLSFSLLENGKQAIDQFGMTKLN